MLCKKSGPATFSSVRFIHVSENGMLCGCRISHPFCRPAAGSFHGVQNPDNNASQSTLRLSSYRMRPLSPAHFPGNSQHSTVIPDVRDRLPYRYSSCLLRRLLFNCICDTFSTPSCGHIRCRTGEAHNPRRCRRRALFLPGNPWECPSRCGSPLWGWTPRQPG